MRKRACVILIEDGKIAVIKRENVTKRKLKNYYTLPGGGVEDGETFEIAAIREAKEELGIDCKILKEEFEIVDDFGDTKYFTVAKTGGTFGTGIRPEFSQDPNYVDSGTYLPLMLDIDELKNINLMPDELTKKIYKICQKFTEC